MCKNHGEAYGEEDYYNQLAQALAPFAPASSAAPVTVVVDCANGVGAKAVAGFTAALRAQGGSWVELSAINDGWMRPRGEGGSAGGALNHLCGAEHVQKSRQLPAGVGAGPAAHGVRYASFDGDADRVVLFYVRDDGGMELLDGDRALALLSLFIARRLAALRLGLSLGVVQTAYANGASTAFLSRELGAIPECRWDILHHTLYNRKPKPVAFNP